LLHARTVEPDKQPLVVIQARKNRPVSKQQLDKHMSSINTPQKYTFFYVIRAATVIMKWCGKQASTIERLFSELFVPTSYLEDNWPDKEVSEVWPRVEGVGIFPP
jgi:hypothetical protein